MGNCSAFNYMHISAEAYNFKKQNKNKKVINNA